MSLRRKPRPLPVTRVEEGLGRDTIMDRGLAVTHGARYVHLVVFAIDVDRIRELVEEAEAIGDQGLVGTPMAELGWDVFLTECYLVDRMDPSDEQQRAMLNDVATGILELDRDEPALGTQLAFAIYDAARRGVFSEEMIRWFARWKKRPDRMLERLAPFFETREATLASLAELCLEADLDPPLAPPTRDALSKYLGQPG